MKFNTIQHILQTIRTRHNLTQVEFAEKIFVSRQTVSNWERGISTPPVTALTIIAKTFNMPLPEIVSALKGQQTDKAYTAERQLLVDAFLSLLSRHNGVYCDIDLIIQEAGIAHQHAIKLFNSPSAILQYIAKQIDAQVIAALSNSTATDPFEMIADYVLPVLYDNNHTLKILYTGHYANGEWLYFLKKVYIKWATPFFENYNLGTAPVSREFAIDLTVKTTLAIISTWLTQPIPTKPDDFRQTFLHLAHTPIAQIVSP
ncbi:Transcriptional regulator [Leuconostoc gasicomitatum]|uniref:helix-turn-helix transcriptional regulator n=1 Tax=Leuconostoc gasicomitatum TaxID=115778 RepID=UPI000BD04FC0|nr:helix-turn-helix transcriptional regulator [Leuconostoc gasicomitatum]MBZ5944945.1 helix-turn-helix transcriptional regulator [Leuconostoc gasicomitatum]MBZ5945794.1 helix-turn-helix transcriptional regulator [Leuconostoc gasicomitatum]MBZ5949802.1 helix-turn-helix transcriptional regulator [Leuconostoc gasicomitatum]MBZ5951121.1 helix-turn-helix transcriptional regulator [Leuconostoc gasicomitatum]MBZ5968541.1 helix-turn-helix transcriptional regulator [Leuconostoc gasicomitatum]